MAERFLDSSTPHREAFTHLQPQIVSSHDLDQRACRYAHARPDRFSVALGGHDLLHPMANLARLVSAAESLPVAYTVVGPSFWGDGMYAPSDAVYYPLYTKCCELDLPLFLNTGLPGPPITGGPRRSGFIVSIQPKS